MSDLFAGKKQIRERSVDSTRSVGSSSGRRVVFTPTTVDEKSQPTPAATKTEPPAPSNTSAVDSLRNMGNSLNPLNRFAGINVLPRFGRAVSSSSTPVLPSPISEQPKQLPSPDALSRTGTGEVPQVDEKGAKAIAAIEQLKKTPPPVKRFLEAKDAQELKLKEVEELLREYQRLAAAMRGAINH
jgi:hypothetical protein